MGDIPDQADNAVGPQPFSMNDFAIDDFREMKVIAIGAGMSGILAGIRFRQRIPKVKITIYEKEDHIGGTWYVNRYPGVACDIPAHSYQYSFENKSDWSAFYSSGAEILSSLDDIVKKYKLESMIHLQHEMIGAHYEESTGRWHVRIRRPRLTSPGEFDEMTDEADFLFVGVGILNRWNWPDIPGLRDFEGTLVHSADWNLGGQIWEDDVKDWGNKNIAVIGAGSSGLQIVSALQPKVGHLYHFARGSNWVSPPVAVKALAQFLNREISTDDNLVFSEDDKNSFTTDPSRAVQLRRMLDDEANGTISCIFRESSLQKLLQDKFRAYMRSRLSNKPEIAAHLIPHFSVGCRRNTPAPGYLHALNQDNVDFVATSIKRITADGIETVDGRVARQDIIICATGFDVSYRYSFPILGRNGRDIRDKWTPHPVTYLSICVDEFPNCFFAAGPNSAAGAGSFLGMIEHQVDYAVMAVAKLQRERLKSIEVKTEAVRDFQEVVKSFFPQTVFAENVSTWLKMGQADGPVTAVWPGSNLHHMRALRHPRWEDFNYERLDQSENRLRWFGNGMTLNEQTMSGDRSWNLASDYIDVPSVPLDTTN